MPDSPVPPSPTSSELTGQQRADQLIAQLQDVTEQLAATGTQAEIFEFILRPALAVLGATAGMVLLVQGDALNVTAQYGQDAGIKSVWQDGPLSDRTPATAVLRTREPWLVEHSETLTATYPDLEARTGGKVAVGSAILPMFLEGQPLGVLVLDFQQPHHFTEPETRFLRTLAAQCAVALGRAQLTTDLQEQVRKRTAIIEHDARAYEVFVSFTEAVGAHSDVLALAQQAVEVLRRRFPDGSAAYYERVGDLWKARVWSDDLRGDLLALITAGLPETPLIREVLRVQDSVFVDGWNATREEVEHSEEYGTAVNVPLFMAGEVGGILALALRDNQRWAEQDKTLVHAVARGLNLALERTEFIRLLETRNVELDARTKALQRFAILARTPETDALALIGRAQEAVAELIGEGFAVYYQLEGESWMPKSQAGGTEHAPLQASLSSALPYDTTHNLRFPWETGQPLYQDRYNPTLDHDVPGSETIASTATLPLFVGTECHGIFAYGLNVSRPWTRGDKAILETAVNSLGLALERAEHARTLEAERAALDAFVAFSEAVGTQTDVLALARQAMQALQTRFPNSSGTYYERQDGLWKGRVWTEDMTDELLAMLQAGFPEDTPILRDAQQARQLVFREAWNPEEERVERSGEYQATVAAPLIVQEEVRGILGFALRDVARWSESDKALVRAVVRGLTLALERADVAARLAEQNAELDARTRALEGFANLTRDLSTEANQYGLVKRAQEVVMSLLSDGYALYYERDGERWRNRVQIGETRNPDLQAFIDAGPLVGVTPSVDVPWTTSQALYQDQYAQGSDTPLEMVEHVSTVASLPVLRRGEVAGVFIAVLFAQRTWAQADRAVLETVVRSLGLALERAEGIVALAARTEELVRSNAELEQFAYVASHDLQEPLRTITSFSQLLALKYQGRLDEKADIYIRLIGEATARMGTLLQDLLAFSRVGAGAHRQDVVDMQEVLAQVRQDLQAQIERSGATVHISSIPSVIGDGTQLRQLFQNLLGNALKFRDPGRAPEVYLDAQDEGNFVRITVRDNGIGIETEYFDRIFTIFQRLHTRDRYEGSGIGLSIARKIVERHGGRLGLKSNPGGGTVFSLTLPKKRAA
ncbi:GAF domain-containing protein [Deinococcus peraridilitoris]|uniref:histidine kinase n=1 Tax=Deinococcus peraridilitoris (strain DSM 19664 / LMG 22246 / CIP 109416 / KR-200) TaxID=937777 RepID=L0A8U0_DEIPD|nr:GAF domain-containing protein [Deinococcus peraridilitoris]AFZ69485.1 bacteriophytochrome (light-regulated signal transduction histidine kinase) [Deinococcus peraridilitoris DSM 19664]